MIPSGWISCPTWEFLCAREVKEIPSVCKDPLLRTKYAPGPMPLNLWGLHWDEFTVSDKTDASNAELNPHFRLISHNE